MGYLEACDTLINEPNPFRMDIQRANALRFETIRGSFEHHYANNAIYRAFCEAMHVKPDDIKTFDDIPKIALITSEFFKQISAYSEKDLNRIISVPPESIVHYFTTSGTTGKPSKYPFDRESLDRLNRSNVQIMKHIGGIEKDDKVIFLSLSPKEATTAMVHGMFQFLKTYFGEEGAKEQIRYAQRLDEKGNAYYKMDEILSFMSDNKNAHLYGPPYAYKDVAQELIKSGSTVKMGEKSKAFTTGGWKGRKNEMLTPRELNQMIDEAFGIDEGNIRDGLGLTDIFSIMLECKYHKKHIPPWMHVSARLESDNMEDIKIMMPKNQQGIIAFLTSPIQSYPAFITTGDLGSLTTGFDEKCECGNIGPTVKYGGRSGDPRGCALVEMEKMQRSIFDMGGGKAGSAKPIDDPAATTQRGPKPPVNNGYEGHAVA